MDIERDLNLAKEKLNRKDFSQLKQNSAFESGIKSVRKQIEANLKGQHVTKAWLKMVDLLFQEAVWSRIYNKQVKVFFNAELPGGFVFAANHVFQTNKIPFDWVVSSLYPREVKSVDHIADMFGLIERNPEHSLVGPITIPKGTFWSDGDLTNPKMCDILAKLAQQKLGKVNLYTADGGIDTDDRPEIQEVLTTPVISGEVRVAVQVLDLGGVAIIKMFTFFTPVMRNLIIWFGRHFDQYTFVKPAASSSLNSEVYFLGLGFKGPVDLPSEVEITPEEDLFLNNYSRSFAQNQIKTIQDLVQGTDKELDVWSYRRLSPLDMSLWLPTTK